MKVLWIVLAVLGGICLICGGVAFWGFSKAKGGFDEAGKFGDDSFRAIATNWDIKEFDKRAAPEIAQQEGKDAIPKLLDQMKQSLGPLNGQFTSHITGLNSHIDNGIGVTYADWNATASFEKGSGSVTMQLINRGGTWQILKFGVDSPLIKGDGAPPKIGPQ